MKAHVSSSAQEPIKEAALKKVISNAKVGAVVILSISVF